MADEKIRVLVIGAHPDDPEVSAGGTVALYTRAGHTVKFVTLTDGGAGHHVHTARDQVVARRRDEADAVEQVLGVAYTILDCPDGELEPTLARREQVIAEIRRFKPDLVMTHRPNDYHPDHRYTSQLVQDASYMVTVPLCMPDVPALGPDEDPTIVYVADTFQKPYPFRPTVAVAIDETFDLKMDSMHAHTSQMYEWLPRDRDDVPADDAGRRAWLPTWRGPRFEEIAGQYRDLLVKFYGQEVGSKVRYAEAFEPSEYGAPLTEANIPRLFPFLPWV